MHIPRIPRISCLWLFAMPNPKQGLRTRLFAGRSPRCKRPAKRDPAQTNWVDPPTEATGSHLQLQPSVFIELKSFRYRGPMNRCLSVSHAPPRPILVPGIWWDGGQGGMEIVRFEGGRTAWPAQQQQAQTPHGPYPVTFTVQRELALARRLLCLVLCLGVSGSCCPVLSIACRAWQKGRMNLPFPWLAHRLPNIRHTSLRETEHVTAAADGPECFESCQDCSNRDLRGRRPQAASKKRNAQTLRRQTSGRKDGKGTSGDLKETNHRRPFILVEKETHVAKGCNRVSNIKGLFGALGSLPLSPPAPMRLRVQRPSPSHFETAANEKRRGKGRGELLALEPRPAHEKDGQSFLALRKRTKTRGQKQLVWWIQQKDAGIEEWIHRPLGESPKNGEICSSYKKVPQNKRTAAY